MLGFRTQGGPGPFKVLESYAVVGRSGLKGVDGPVANFGKLKRLALHECGMVLLNVRDLLSWPLLSKPRSRANCSFFCMSVMRAGRWVTAHIILTYSVSSDAAHVGLSSLHSASY